MNLYNALGDNFNPSCAPPYGRLTESYCKGGGGFLLEVSDETRPKEEA